LREAASAAKPRFILNLQCAETKGIVAKVSGFLAENDASIVESSQFADGATNQFFMRTVFEPFGHACPELETLSSQFQCIANTFDMIWSLRDARHRPRVLIAVSKIGHCLFDLLHRWRSGNLAMDVCGVVSNHDDMRSFVEWNGLPYYYLPQITKAGNEAAIVELLDSFKIELFVLARYMQILSSEFCTAVSGRCINIHHSFLPSFKGAKPYHQAHERGVKIIGATAHYVTSDLDEGPIIEQGVQRVSHADTPDKLVAIGRDIECAVLARAVAWHIERRIMLTGQKTIVFS